MSTSGRGQVLIPWPNRLRGRQLRVRRAHATSCRSTSRQRGNAIHGLVRWARLDGRRPGAAAAPCWSTRSRPQPGYPFTLALAIEYSLVGRRAARCTTTATNVGADAVPVRSRRASVPDGRHADGRLGRPARPGGHGAAVRRARAARRRGAVDGTEYDFRRPRPIGATQLDTAFTGLERGADGLARVELADPDGDSGVVLWVDDGYRYLMLFTGDAGPMCRGAASPSSR